MASWSKGGVRKFFGIITLTCLLIVSACGQQLNKNEATKHEFTNHLINESSPYLLQHAHNPVNWYPWGEEALTKAKSENKLIIISIGYSACHWCHVMERESFEDTTVAKTMNEHFVSIKIDREERPDIDQVYIEAAQMLNNGRAGWPLNVITLPDATPVFAGTYFPKNQWMQILGQIQDIYENNPDRLSVQAARIKEDLVTLNQSNSDGSSRLDAKELTSAMRNWKLVIDRQDGGIRSNQKFPLPGSIEQFMSYGFLMEDKVILNLSELTLDRMALGGIFDHVGGGFHRYTVEPKWKVPHFEKMLYDNAQLVSLYSKAYKLYGKELYKDAVVQTLQFISKEMTSSEGGFYSSYDADSEDEEGKFYVWSHEEIVDVLGERSESFLNYYSVSKKGNWEEEKNVLYAKADPYSYFENTEDYQLIRKDLGKLHEIRNRRIKPGLDDKILTSWNALMIVGYVNAYKALGDNEYLDAAISNADFLIENQLDSFGRLNRNYKNGTSTINAFLDDYAFTIRAFLELYQATFDIQWLNRSLNLMNYALEHFYDDERQLFRFKSDLDESLIIEKFETNDNVTPSGNSTMCYNLYLLGNLFYDNHREYLDISTGMLRSVSDDFIRMPYYYYGWLPILHFQNEGLYEIAVVGRDYQTLLSSFHKKFIPDAVFLGGPTDTSLPLLENKLVKGETFIYVCREKYCKLPVKDVSEAIKQIERK